jgi:hypothetical protein
MIRGKSVALFFQKHFNRYSISEDANEKEHTTPFLAKEGETYDSDFTTLNPACIIEINQAPPTLVDDLSIDWSSTASLFNFAFLFECDNFLYILLTGGNEFD